MHKGAEQIAVTKAQVEEFKAKGYELGAKEDWSEGVLMCYKGEDVIVEPGAVDKYVKQGADRGACDQKKKK
jgi:hypothetical protein